jgi:TorA maturation chaperone TorD
MARHLAPAELARLRQGLYRFFAACFLYPDEKRLSELAAAYDALQGAGVEAFSFYGPFEELSDAFLEAPEIEKIQADFVRLFVLGTSSDPTFPNESSQLALGGTEAGALCARLAEEYASMGIVVSGETFGSPDHLSVQLEVMAWLCAREAEAWQCAREAEVWLCSSDGRSETPRYLAARENPILSALSAELGFLMSHPAGWVPLFSKRLRSEAPGSFYTTAASALGAFLVHDQDLIEALVEESERLR